MSTEQIACFKLRCDTKISDQCEDSLKDWDTEGDIHGSTPEEIRLWAHAATSNGGFNWWITPKADTCGACRREIGKHAHDFTANEPGSDICAYCEDSHEIPGQIAIGGEA